MPRRKAASDVILPPELDDGDEDDLPTGIPDDQGWIHLEEKEHGPQLGNVPPKKRVGPVARRNARRRRE
jgi:hypothetical protein